MRPESFDETAIKDMHALMIEAWNSGNGAGFAAPFAHDADFIAFEGTQLKGRDNIQMFHQVLFDRELAGTRLEGGVLYVRFLSPTLAIMHSWATTTLAGQANASPSRDSMQLFVATKQNGDWFFDTMLSARRITLNQQKFLDDFGELPPMDQRAITHKVSSLRH